MSRSNFNSLLRMKRAIERFKLWEESLEIWYLSCKRIVRNSATFLLFNMRRFTQRCRTRAILKKSSCQNAILAMFSNQSGSRQILFRRRPSLTPNRKTTNLAGVLDRVQGPSPAPIRTSNFSRNLDQTRSNTCGLRYRSSSSPWKRTPPPS